MIREAAARDLPCILTTTFDTGVGTALSPSTSPRSCRTPAPPAASQRSLSSSATSCAAAPPPRRVRSPFPAGPGLGVVLDDDALDRFATGPWEGVPA